MPSQSDTGSSSSSLLFDFDLHHPVVPQTIYDPDWDGLQIEGESNVPCDHGINLRKYVAFTRINTGRRFLGCANEVGLVCEIVDWVDVKWPDALKKEEKKDLEAENQNLQVVLNDTVSGTMVEGSAQKLLDIQKLMIQKAEKQRDQLKEEKKKMEYYIADMLNAGDVNKDKL